MREDLIPVLKTVERLGKTHQQTYWVRPDELRAAVRKTGDGSEAFAMAGGNPAQITKIVAEWSTHTGTKEALRLRGAAVALVHGDNPEALAKETEFAEKLAHHRAGKERMGAAGTKAHVDGATEAFARGLTDPQVHANLAAMAAVSQAMYPDEEEVTVYRGVYGIPGEQIREEWWRLSKGNLEAEGEMEISVGVLSSYSESRAAAEKIAYGEGIVFELKVPRSAIVMSHRVPGTTEVGWEGEEEVVALSHGTIKVPLSKVKV